MRAQLLLGLACLRLGGAMAPAWTRPPHRTGQALLLSHCPSPAPRTSEPSMMAASSSGALLGLTILLEVLATTSMKLAESSPLWYVGVFAGYGACFSIFPLVLRKMPLGVAYAIWSGLGT